MAKLVKFLCYSFLIFQQNLLLYASQAVPVITNVCWILNLYVYILPKQSSFKRLLNFELIKNILCLPINVVNFGLILNLGGFPGV